MKHSIPEQIELGPFSPFSSATSASFPSLAKKLSQNDEQASLRYQSNAQANWRSAR
jgi:hypothetical protein